VKKKLHSIFSEVQKTHWWFVARKKIVFNILRDFSGKNTKKVLDVGCGSGLMIEEFDSLYNMYGLEKSRTAIKLCGKKHRSRIKIGSLPISIPYRNKSFDCILALDVLEHIKQDKKSLLSIHKLLKKNGFVIITVPAFMFLWSSFDEENHHHRRYTYIELKEKLENSGFKILKLTYYNFFLSPISFLSRYLMNRFVSLHRQSLKIPSPPINQILQLIFTLEYFFIKRINFPFGLSLIAIARKSNSAIK
jgi:2-polyprenyl-3-methyl-5-hydroxy-6-metoxy-1,4-benzoquinol methylase